MHEQPIKEKLDATTKLCGMSLCIKNMIKLME